MDKEAIGVATGTLVESTGDSARLTRTLAGSSSFRLAVVPTVTNTFLTQHPLTMPPVLRPQLLLSLLFLTCLTTACGPEPTPEYGIVHGRFPAGTAAGEIKGPDGWQDFAVAADGTFTDTLAVTEPGYVDLNVGDQRFWIYLGPGDEVTISEDSTLTFTGSHAAANAILYGDVLSEQEMADSFEHIFGQGEGEFVVYQDSVRAARRAELAALPAGNEAFQAFHGKCIDYEYQLDAARYSIYHNYFADGYEPSDTILGIFENVDVSNETDARRYPVYRAVVSRALELRSENLADSTLGTLAASLAVLDEVESPTILHHQLQEALYYFNANTKDMEGVRDRMLALAKLDKTTEAVNERYELMHKLKPGSPSPTFDYENYAGGNTRLEDLRGKYVYVDVWATWCGPCIGEIPHLKRLERELHDANIEFVSISIDELTSRDSWRSMIENRELGGTQLLADKDWESDFVRGYGIRGIPHFILLDEQGNIVSADAERPSNPALRDRLDGLTGSR